jgi:uncharacterized protein YodC (DUF2158 family)
MSSFLKKGVLKMAEFKPGDVVQLKSGGPKMTVTQVGNDGFGHPAVWVVWFGEKNKQEKSTFAPDTLEIVD